VGLVNPSLSSKKISKKKKKFKTNYKLFLLEDKLIPRNLQNLKKKKRVVQNFRKHLGSKGKAT